MTGVRRDAAEFLRTRRARVTPERAGMPAGGARRRVPGLRREEVALLAGVSVDYYARLERGSWQVPRRRYWMRWPARCG